MPATCIRFSFDAIWSVHSLLICSDCYPFAVAALAECPPWPWASVIFGPWLFVRNQVNVASWPLIQERQAQWAAKKQHLVSMRRKVYRRLGNCYLWKYMNVFLHYIYGTTFHTSKVQWLLYLKGGLINKQCEAGFALQKELF